MKNKILIFGYAFLCHIVSLAQISDPISLFPSPNATEMSRFSAVQVGLFTGTAQYSIPIYEFKTPNLTLPIKLEYSSNGLMVDKIASWVGFDWSLNAGGIINRYVKGRVDNPNLSRPVYSPTLFSSWKTSQKFTFLETYTSTGGQDLEPDEYVFSFQNYSGKFVFDEVGNIKLIPYSNLKIENTGTGGFKITAPDGIIYTFENKASTYPQTGSTFITSWYLTTIIHPAGDVITFNYATARFSNYFGVEQSVSATVATTSPSNVCPTPQVVEKVNSTINDVFFLTSIDFQSHGKIIFEISSQDREDSYLDYKLNKIKITDASNNPIKSIQFFYQFPVCAYSYPSGTLSGITEYNNEHSKRMFLDSIQIQDDLGKRINSYSFLYNNLDQLPARYSYSQDHWGYFNGKYNNDLVLLSEVPVPYQFNFTNYITSNNDRNPDYTFSKKGMLQKITFPTGGYTSIEYEPNKDNYGTEVGGCRVVRTKTAESGTSLIDIKKYIYSNVSNKANISYYREFTTYSSGEYYNLCTIGFLSSKSYYNLFLNGQYFVLYQNVEILNGENGENGKEVHTFLCQYDNIAIPDASCGGPVFPMPTSNSGWNSGLLDSSYISNSTSTNLWKKDAEYNFTESRNKKQIYCLAVEKKDYPSNTSLDTLQMIRHFRVVPYYINSIWYYMNQEQVTNYSPNGNLVTTKSYSYNDIGLLSSESSTGSDGDIIETKYTYPTNYYWGSSPTYNGESYYFKLMVDRNMINIPVEKTTLKNNLITGSELTLFQLKNNIIVPKENYSLEFTTPFTYPINGLSYTTLGSNQVSFGKNSNYKLTNQYQEFDTKGNIQQTTGKDGIVTSYLWDSTGNYPMAKVEGGTYSQISSQNGKASSFDSKTLYNSLKILVPTAVIKTFSFKPLVGMSSQTDPNGVTTYYEYDDFGRLKWIKNDDGYITNRNTYHYKQ